ncbi:thioesterase family protein [Sphingomonas changnyeongensis]|uniref:Thioesterase family protein n=1 Tax=Sphingomonas changnyeongensis TaxID=2698679 RepID=A0A7Z2NU43_9SPHN|nr:thioesterase family protein [Sphingomonas changnyeongensis]QHL89886.1 thioesterase family protein [Sphingomonas changnyeongensis]
MSTAPAIGAAQGADGTSQPTGFGALIAALTPLDRADGSTAGLTTELPENWTQGRTAYGGLSAALCVEAARRMAADLPPLRSGQFAFAGPAAGRLDIRPELVRRGRSAATMAVALDGDQGPAVRALLTYGAARDSRVGHDSLAAPDVAGPDDCPAFFPSGGGPRFAANMEMRLAAGNRPLAGGDPAFWLWVRHRAPDGADPLTALVALADSPPPAAMVGFPAPAPISTMTWTLDLLGDPGDDPGVWRLLHSVSEQAGHGYSAQAMTLWDADRRPLAVARQMVALFT